MRVPLKWLNEFVQADVDPVELARRLTLAGLEVEKIDVVGAGWEKVFTASVKKVERHPDADRLVLADVEAGEHRLTVVTGANGRSLRSAMFSCGSSTPCWTHAGTSSPVSGCAIA